jgi:hypothetical protein
MLLTIASSLFRDLTMSEGDIEAAEERAADQSDQPIG